LNHPGRDQHGRISAALGVCQEDNWFLPSSKRFGGVELFETKSVSSRQRQQSLNEQP